MVNQWFCIFKILLASLTPDIQLAVLTITGLAFRDLFGRDGPSVNSYTSYHHLTAVKQ